MKHSLVHSTEYLIIDDYPRHSFLKDEICESIENMEDVHDKKTIVKAKMSHWDINSDEISKLKTFIMDNKSGLGSYSYYGRDIKKFYVWANCYEKGDYTVEHDHIPSLLSFAYFLKSKRHFSPLVFEGKWRKIKIKPIEGRIVIFPSHIRHSVPIHRFSDTRITLSGNMTCCS